MMCSRVDLEGAREINTRRGRALALAASSRDGAMGSHFRESLLVTARSQDTKRFGYLIQGASGLIALTITWA